MWHVANIVQALALVVIAALLLWYAYQWQRQRSEKAAQRREEEALRYEEEAPQREHEEKKRRLASHGTRDIEDVDPAAASRENLKFLGVPDVEAGSELFKVPCLNPEQEGGWQGTRQIVTVSRIVIYTKQGTRPLELVEMTDGYLLLATGRATYILKRYKLTATQESALERERKEAIELGDGIIQNYLGHSWEIKGAYGQNHDPAAGEPACSYLQVLGTHPKLGEAGISTVLPQNALDGQPHDYYDAEAISTDGEPEQTMFGFYCAGQWNCYIGRKLDEPEVSAMKAA